MVIKGRCTAAELMPVIMIFALYGAAAVLSAGESANAPIVNSQVPEKSMMEKITDPFRNILGSEKGGPVDLEKDIPVAEQALKDREFDMAYSLMSKAIREYPDNIKVIYIYGMASFHKQDYARAIFAYEKVLQLNPRHEAARYGLAQSYFLTRQYEIARGEFKQVLTRNPPENVKRDIGVYLEKIEKGVQRFLLSGRLEVTLIDDSNVNVGPDYDTIAIEPVVFGSQVFDKLTIEESSKPKPATGYASSLVLMTVYDVGDVGAWMMTGDAMLYNNWLSAGSDFETLYGQLSVGLRRITAGNVLALPVKYSRIDYGHNNLVVDMIGIAPAYSYTPKESRYISFITGLTVENREYKPLNKRDGTFMGLSETLRVSDDSGNVMTMGVSFYTDQAKAGIYEYKGMSWSLGADWRIYGGIILQGKITYGSSDYKEQEVISPLPREDNQVQFAVRASKAFKNFGVGVGWQKTDNNSSFGVYEYQREIYTIGSYYSF